MNTENAARLETISLRIRQIDPDAYPALLLSFIGGFKGACRFAPQDMDRAVDVMETILENFDTGTQA